MEIVYRTKMYLKQKMKVKKVQFSRNLVIKDRQVVVLYAVLLKRIEIIIT
jgi:hypothetical protein